MGKKKGAGILQRRPTKLESPKTLDAETSTPKTKRTFTLVEKAFIGVFVLVVVGRLFVDSMAYVSGIAKSPIKFDMQMPPVCVGQHELPIKVISASYVLKIQAYNIQKHG